MAFEGDNDTEYIMWKPFLLEKGDIILYRHQRSIAFFKCKCWQCFPSSFFPAILSLLPFVSPSFFHSGKIASMLKTCFVFNGGGRPLSQVQMVLHTVLFLELMARASDLGQMKCLSRKVSLEAGKGPQSTCSRSPSELMAGSRNSAPSYSVFAGISPCFTDYCSLYVSLLCFPREVCPSKQLSFFEEGR